MLQDVDTAVSVCYTVALDNVSLGTFSTCEGLGCEVVIESREEGGNNSFVWQLPTRLKYPNITLTRPLGKDTEKIAKWFAGIASGYTRCTGIIEVMSANGNKIAGWELYDVVPVRWKGPSLNPDQPKVIMESLEIAHHGFVSKMGR
jgi:phage tail-like protein